MTVSDRFSSSPVPFGTAARIERWLYAEARLLDERRYDEWLAVLADDIHYWMPGVEIRASGDPNAVTTPGRMAYFDDDKHDLERRVRRFQQPTAWAEDPPTRHVHLISNIEVDEAEHDDEFVVRSVFTNVRAKRPIGADLLYGRRVDVLRLTDGALLLARRRIEITDVVLNSRNLNTFL